jgi:uncharacterized protein (UPF0335 family)
MEIIIDTRALKSKLEEYESRISRLERIIEELARMSSFSRSDYDIMNDAKAILYDCEKFKELKKF